MPDVLKRTVSATEVPALFDASPYLTRWMLYRRFACNDDISSPEHSRMDWGKRLEPVLLAAAAEELRLEVKPNRDEAGEQIYVRNRLIGCTRDADIFCPDRGPGALETKCVFDYGVWMREWNGGKNPPRHIELQLQTQMKVGDGAASYAWGTLAVFCGGEMFYFERQPIPELWEAVEEEAERFFADIEEKREPDPFGVQIEVPLLTKVFPVETGSILDMRTVPTDEEAEKARKIAENVRMLDWHSRERLGHDKAEKALKAQVQALMKTHETLLLPAGISAKLAHQTRKAYSVKESSFNVLNVHVPADVDDGAI